ncbi:MAG: hypothetical protein DRH03_03535 [Deltaproteobacteria bacterium]|nr:MAG: hypothetical protein DRH03_03535 [Deltaproteobacteria bacterium]
MKTSVRRIFLYVIMITLSGTLLWGCAGSKKPAEVKCSGDVEWQLCGDAEITSFVCELGSFKKKPALVYTVAVKNNSAKPHRYRLNIFLLDQDKAAGHLVPRKGKPPVVKPGETVTVKVPFFKATKTSEKMLVILKTLGE